MLGNSVFNDSWCRTNPLPGGDTIGRELLEEVNGTIERLCAAVGLTAMPVESRARSSVPGSTPA